MSRLVINGWGAVTCAGVGRVALAERFDGRSVLQAAATADAQTLYSERLPPGGAHALIAFDVRTLLGRKGTSTLDRRSALAMVACGEALEDSHLGVTDESRHRIGLALGTTCGSFKSMSDFTRQSFTERKPYLVDPSQFPNTVLNCAAGQIAIRFGLKGLNATIAGGTLAFLAALSYTSNALARGYADSIVTGAVEELTPHNAWSAHRCAAGRSGATPGEAAALFVIESADRAAAARREPLAWIESVITGFCPGGLERGNLGASLAGCVMGALNGAGISASNIGAVAPSVAVARRSGDGNAHFEISVLRDVLADSVCEWIDVTSQLGECQAATGALQMAALLCRGALPDPTRQHALLTGWSPEGGVGAAVMRVH